MRQDPEDPSPWRRLLGWLPGGPRSRRTPPPEQQGLRVAAILDDFSATSFRPEADLLLLSPENWAAELAAHRPELVLVESAWRGRDGQWAGKIAGNGTELGGILAWANAMGVPTVFWNKEDPVHFWTFLATTRGFDHVFTTDLDCIARYKSALGHGRVHLLPFACQPQLHNPLELYPRRKAMSFAGAYYRRFPARMRVLESFVGSLPELCPIEIFDRNFGEDGPWKFPPEYESLIVGTLPPERIDLAYKGYRYTLNLNSVQSSPTMFARRVYETLACNTLTASNYSRGLRLMFGDMVPNADDGPALLARLRAVAAQPSREARLRLMALRKVMREHTCRDRLDFIRARTLSPDAPPVWRPPQVVALAEARDSATAARIAASFLAQSHTESRLILVADDPAWGPAHPRIETHARGSLGRLHLQDLVGPRDWLACLSTFDHYGPHYLTDLILATRYSRASLIGKAAHFRWDADGPIHVDAGLAYRPMPSCPARRAILRGDRLPRTRAAATLARLDHLSWKGPEGLAIDPWHYAADAAGADPRRLREHLEDLPDLDPGLPLTALQAVASAIAPEAGPETPGFGPDQLADLFGSRAGRKPSLRAEADALVIETGLAGGEPEFIFAERSLPPGEYLPAGSEPDRINCHLEAETGLVGVRFALRFFDEGRKCIGHLTVPCNVNAVAEIPPGTALVQPGLRLAGHGTVRVRRLHLGHFHRLPAVTPGRAARLLVDGGCGTVPGAPPIWRDEPVEIFRLRPGEAPEWREVEGIEVLTGNVATLERLLAGGRYRSVRLNALDSRTRDQLVSLCSRHEVIVTLDPPAA